MKKFLFLQILAIPFLVSAQVNYNSYLKDNASSREHSLDILHMKVALSFNPEKSLVKGLVTHSFKVLQQKVDSVFFDAPGIKIISAKLNNQPIKYSINNQGLVVYPSKSLVWDENGIITFEYEASPRKGIYFIGWNLPAESSAIAGEKEYNESNPFAVRKQIWTQGQGIDNRYWIPMYDEMNDKFTTETLVTFDKNYKVLSNGSLINKTENKDGTTTWNYKMSKPHAGYLLMLAIGKYSVYSSKSSGSVPLNYYYYPEFANRMEPTYRYTPEMMDFLEKETGIKYPWESYSQVMVQDFIFGAMENTTATIFGDFFNVDARAFQDRNYIGVNCHEMTHQWFGDFITARDGRDTWLQESFATYFPKQFSKVNEGIDEWSWQRRSQQNAAVEAGKKDNFPVRHTQGGTSRVYPKGAAVISMLEYVLGEEQWKRALNHYLKTHAYANVETNDLQQAIKDKLGLNLDWFFDEWVYRGGEPNFQIHYEDLTYQDGSRSTEIAVEQVQKTDETVGIFKMPIWFEVHYEDGSFDRVQEMINGQFEVLKIDNKNKKKISFVLFDVNSNIIKQVSFKKSFDELKAQALHAENYIDRYDAVAAMKEIDYNSKREILIEISFKEKHYAIINELVNQLINDKDPKSISAIQKLSQHPKATVRENILNKLSSINSDWKNIAITALFDSSYDVVKVALEKLCYQYPADAPNFLDVSKNVMGMNNSVKIKWLEISINLNIKKADAARQISYFAGPFYEFRTRNNAFASLKNINYLDEAVIKNLFQAICSTNSRLANPAAETANYFAAQFAYKDLMKNVFAKSNFDARENEILSKQLAWLK